ncbi:hypothetical protein JYT85_01340, partial [Desulfocapsa sp. AH-315-G09]|nr:hypothetical protein [Desulfocapsa sp. AH-315-G09]
QITCRFLLTAPSDLSSLPRSLSEGAAADSIFQTIDRRVDFNVDTNDLFDYVSDLVAGYLAQQL